MTKRLIWNFAIDSKNALNFQETGPNSREEFNWEARYFWPESSQITLHACPSSVLGLHEAQLKYKTDSYFIIPDLPFNLKKRRGELLYKPLIKRNGGLCGYDKKLILIDQDRALTLPGEPAISAGDLWEKINTQSHEITVYKTSLSIPLPTVPKIKMELSRIAVHQQIYFSASLEGYSLPLIESISQSLLPDTVSCDYVSFLQKIMKR